jgi:hypothetical protein
MVVGCLVNPMCFVQYHLLLLIIRTWYRRKWDVWIEHIWVVFIRFEWVVLNLLGRDRFCNSMHINFSRQRLGDRRRLYGKILKNYLNLITHPNPCRIYQKYLLFCYPLVGTFHQYIYIQNWLIIPCSFYRLKNKIKTIKSIYFLIEA